jgi:hypothetical protein
VGRKCSVCTHPDRAEIDNLLLAHGVYRAITDRFGPTRQSLKRHLDEHIPKAMAQAAEADRESAAVRRGTTLADEVARLRAEASSIGAAARKQQDLRTALAAVEKQGRLIELQAKLIGELDSRAQVNILMHPDFAKIRVLLVGSVGPCPECRARVAEGLRALEAGDG